MVQTWLSITSINGKVMMHFTSANTMESTISKSGTNTSCAPISINNLHLHAEIKFETFGTQEVIAH